MNCRGCGSSFTQLVVDLGEQVAADHFPLISEREQDGRWPLELWLCASCTLVQLGPVEPLLPETPLSVESATSRDHAESSVAALLCERPHLFDVPVAEFASHHGGSWLPALRAGGCRVAAEDELAEFVVDVHGLAHDVDLGMSLAMRAERLAPGGELLLEFHHLLPLVRDCQFDTIRHGHWSYLSLGAVQRLAAPLGLELTAATEVPLFGGSLQVLLRRVGRHSRPYPADDSVAAVLAAEASAGLDDPLRLVELHADARTSATALHDYLVDQRESGRSVLGYGAPSKAPLLLGLSGVGPDLLPFTVDAAPGKHGRRIPGVGVPIRPIDDLRTARPDVVLILTWDIADEVISELESDGGWGATYVVPMPVVREVSPLLGSART